MKFLLPLCLLVGLISVAGEETDQESLTVGRLAIELHSALQKEGRANLRFQKIYELIQSSYDDFDESSVNALLYLESLPFDWSTGSFSIDRNDEQATFVSEQFFGEEDVPNYSELEIARHIMELYRLQNRERWMGDLFERDDPAKIVAFLAMADRMDGRLDVKVGFPNLDGLYDLWMVSKTPTSAVCYDCRLDGTWKDRRTFINKDRVEKFLPRKFKRDFKRNENLDTRINLIVDYIHDVVTPTAEPANEDFWKDPVETLVTGEGDCEDFALLFQSVAEHMGLESKVMVGFVVYRNDDGGYEYEGHAWNQIEGRVIDLAVSPDQDIARYIARLEFDSVNSAFVE